MIRQFDAVVVGAGAGGLTVLDDLVKAGLRTALIERDRPGGECTFRGCVPTKTLLRSAQVAHLSRRAGAYGVHVGKVTVDFSEIRSRKDRIIAEISENGSFQPFEDRGITVFRGSARFVAERELEVNRKRVRGEHIVLATGSRPSLPPLPGLAGADVMTNIEAVDLAEIPGRLVVIGGGPLALEFAQLFRRLGSDVTVLESGAHILPHEDADLADLLHRYLEEEGVAIHLDTTVERVERGARGTSVVTRNGGATRCLRADRILVATGRDATSKELSLDRGGIRTDEDGWIQVDEQQRTSAKNTWAVGDCTGGLKFTHVADYMGRVAAHNILHPERPITADLRVVPWATFTDPAFGRVGVLEEEARAQGRAVVSGTLDWSELERARMDGEERGRVKLVADARTGEIIGGSVLAPFGDSLIAEIAVAMRARLTVDDLFWTIHPYPTSSEALRWAAGRALDLILSNTSVAAADRIAMP